MQAAPPRIGFFGGTFDPIHHAHLRHALELKHALALDSLYLVPSFMPVYRPALGATAAQRLAMLQLAVAGSELTVDAREITRDRFTYTIDSLMELRAEYGAAAQLCFCMGADSLQNLAQWHRFTELTDYAHLIVVGRPGYRVQDPLVAALLARTQGTIADTFTAPAGRLVQVETRLLEISATDIRRQVAAAESVRYLLPDAVLDYIAREGLYRSPAPESR